MCAKTVTTFYDRARAFLQITFTLRLMYYASMNPSILPRGSGVKSPILQIVCKRRGKPRKFANVPNA
jgi:hypothetical protein